MEGGPSCAVSEGFSRDVKWQSLIWYCIGQISNSILGACYYPFADQRQYSFRKGCCRSLCHGVLTLSYAKSIELNIISLKMPTAPDSPTFLIPAPGDRSTPLTYSVYQQMLKFFGELTGLEVDCLLSHSLRCGGCAFLALCGASLEEIRSRVDWKSEAVFAYLKTSMKVRILNNMRVAEWLLGE